MQRSVEFRNEEFFYDISGDGIPVVLIHGFAEDKTIWQEQIAFFETGHYKLVIPDLPGSGKSVFNPQMHSMDDYADAMDQMLIREKINNCIMIGHSMGGYITLAYAEKYPDKLSGFGLFHSSAYADNDEKKATRQKGIEFINEHGSAAFLKQATPNLFSEEFKKNKPEIVEEITNRYTNFNPLSLVHYYEIMMTRPDRTNILRTFDRPVMFIIGEHDTAIPLQTSLEQCHLPRLSYIHISKKSGHMGMLEESKECNQVLRKFFNLTANSTPASSL